MHNRMLVNLHVGELDVLRITIFSNDTILAQNTRTIPAIAETCRSYDIR